MDEHVTTVEPVATVNAGTGYSVACSCGWKAQHKVGPYRSITLFVTEEGAERTAALHRDGVLP